MRGLATACLVASSLATLTAPAQEAPGAGAPAVSYQMDTLRRLPGSFWDDGVALAKAPADWSGRQWSEAALGAAAVLGVGLALDHTVDRSVVRNHRNAWDTPTS